MENFYIQAVVDDLRPRLAGASVGKVWQPSDRVLVVDLKLDDNRLLLVDVDPADPAVYLTRRPLRDLESALGGERAFAALLRKRLRGGRVEKIDKAAGDRLVRFSFAVFGPSGDRERVDLVAALTGRSANAYLVDQGSEILGAMRPVPAESPLRVGERFVWPEGHTSAIHDDVSTLAPEDVASPQLAARVLRLGPVLTAELESRARASGVAGAVESLVEDCDAPPSPRLYTVPGRPPRLVLATFALEHLGDAACESFADPSAAADERASRVARQATLEGARRALRARVDVASERAERLERALEHDVESAEGAERKREIAESLLAQVYSAREVAGGLLITDYYAPEPCEIVVPADRGESPQRVADRLFAAHRKARRTREEAATRLALASDQRQRLEQAAIRLREATTLADLAEIERDVDAVIGTAQSRRTATTREEPAVTGARRFVSSDGYEILVGRSSKANDMLTFKVARSTDLWLHAADYPGSHVVVRNPSRRDVPHRTVIEAAQLAAFYSEARDEKLVDVRYTPRKFVSKPRGAGPGLVRISTFKTIAVQPAPEVQRNV